MVSQGRHAWRCELLDGDTFLVTSLAQARDVGCERAGLADASDLILSIRLRPQSERTLSEIRRRGCDADLYDLVTALPFCVADIADLTRCTPAQIRRSFCGRRPLPRATDCGRPSREPSGEPTLVTNGRS